MNINDVFYRVSFILQLPRPMYCSVISTNTKTKRKEQKRNEHNEVYIFIWFGRIWPSGKWKIFRINSYIFRGIVNCERYDRQRSHNDKKAQQRNKKTFYLFYHGMEWPLNCSLFIVEHQLSVYIHCIFCIIIIIFSILKRSTIFTVMHPYHLNFICVIWCVSLFNASIVIRDCFIFVLH